MIEYRDVQAAQARIAPHIVRTPLLRVPALDEALAVRSISNTRASRPSVPSSFAAPSTRPSPCRRRSWAAALVCASSGNHAQGVAYAAHKLGAQAVIVMPTNANPVKLAGVKRWGGQVELVGTLSSQREDGPPAGAGAGHGGDPPLRRPAGSRRSGHPRPGGPGGPAGRQSDRGPHWGRRADLRHRHRREGSRAPGAHCGSGAGWRAPVYPKPAEGRPVQLESVQTIADGTRTDHANPDNFAVIQARVDELYTVEDRWIEEAMRLLMTAAKVVAEPSSALPVAAALCGALPVRPEDKAVFVLSGGNARPGSASRLLA